MRKIVHLSDLHFGRADAAMAAVLAKTVRDMKPDIVAISGDLTQRARSDEFRAARALIYERPAPRVVVPGNHDIPAPYEPWRRFVGPFRRWHKYIGPDLEPFFADEEVVALGLNTAHSWTVKGGRVTSFQAERVRQVFGVASKTAVRILVGHHPFDIPRNQRHALVAGGAKFFEALAESHVDLILSGHVHEYHIGHSAERYEVAHRSALLVHAGTAISDRIRRESNSFNFLIVSPERVTIIPHLWEYDERAYLATFPEHYVRSERGWARELS